MNGPLGSAQPLGLVGVWRILRKWAWIVAPLIALTFVAVFVATDDIKPEYTAEASVLLVGPNEQFFDDLETGDVNVDDVNPLQQLSGNLVTVARVTVLALSSPEVGESMVDDGLSQLVAIGVENRTPIIRIEARHADQAIATATANRMIELVFEDLRVRQDALDAPETDRISAQIISAGTAGGPDFGARTRVQLGIAAVGLIVACGSAFLLEALEQYRRRNIEPDPVFFGALPAPAPQIESGLPDGDYTFVEWARDKTSSLIGTLHLLTGRRDTAVAYAQQALRATAERWRDIRGTSPQVWLYREALSLVVDEDQRRVDAHLESDALWQSLNGLDLTSRQAVAMTAVSDLTHDEIGEVLEVSDRRLHAILTQATLPSSSRREVDQVEALMPWRAQNPLGDSDQGAEAGPSDADADGADADASDTDADGADEQRAADAADKRPADDEVDEPAPQKAAVKRRPAKDTTAKRPAKKKATKKRTAKKATKKAAAKRRAPKTSSSSGESTKGESTKGESTKSIGKPDSARAVKKRAVSKKATTRKASSTGRSKRVPNPSPGAKAKATGSTTTKRKTSTRTTPKGSGSTELTEQTGANGTGTSLDKVASSERSSSSSNGARRNVDDRDTIGLRDFSTED